MKNSTHLFGIVGIVVGGLAILASIIGLVILGAGDTTADAITAIASIGGAVAGGFAGWMLRGTLDAPELPEVAVPAPDTKTEATDAY